MYLRVPVMQAMKWGKPSAAAGLSPVHSELERASLQALESLMPNSNHPVREMINGQRNGVDALRASNWIASNDFC